MQMGNTIFSEHLLISPLFQKLEQLKEMKVIFLFDGLNIPKIKSKIGDTEKFVSQCNLTVFGCLNFRDEG